MYDNSTITRFWNKVEFPYTIGTNECWVWIAGTARGYGRFAITKRHLVQAHRFSFELVYGFLPNDLLICHTCDNRRCVNPAHLFVGTVKANNQDKCQKNRQPHKVTQAQVDEIRIQSRLGKTTVELGHQYGISHQTVSKIVRRIYWDIDRLK